MQLLRDNRYQSSHRYGSTSFINGWSGFYFQCCVLSLVFLTVSWLLSGEWLAGKSKAEPSRSTLLSFTRYAFLKRAKRCSTTTKKTGTK